MKKCKLLEGACIEGLQHTHCEVRHSVHTPIRSNCVQVVPSAVHPTKDQAGTNLATIPVSQSDQSRIYNSSYFIIMSILQ